MQKLKGSLTFNKTAPLTLFFKREISAEKKFAKRLKRSLFFKKKMRVKMFIKRDRDG